MLHQIQYQLVCHFLHNNPCFICRVRTLQYLSRSGTVRLRTIRFDLCNRARFVPPGMINQKFCIHTKQFVKQIFTIIICFFSDGAARHISHGIHSVFCQFLRISRSDTPEIRDRPVVPKQFTVTFFIQLGNAHTVFIRIDVLCHNIHCDFAQIQVGSDPGSGRDPNVILHIQNDSLRQLISCHSIGFQIMCHVHKHFINRIYMNIFRRHIFQIYIIDPRTVFHIKCHPRRCRNIRQFRLTGFSAAVYLFYFLNHFKKPGSSRNPIFFQGWRNCQADGFFRAAFIRHHQIGGQRIKSTLHTFYGCIK